MQPTSLSPVAWSFCGFPTRRPPSAAGSGIAVTSAAGSCFKVRAAWAAVNTNTTNNRLRFIECTRIICGRTPQTDIKDSNRNLRHLRLQGWSAIHRIRCVCIRNNCVFVCVCVFGMDEAGVNFLWEERGNFVDNIHFGEMCFTTLSQLPELNSATRAAAGGWLWGRGCTELA